MKIVIDITERDYYLACKYPDALIATYAHYIKKGTPYEEKQHGEWIEVTRRISDSETSTYWECSICREHDRKDGKSKFCCGCGAKMRRGER